jgi:hypothetical protein
VGTSLPGAPRRVACERASSSIPGRQEVALGQLPASQSRVAEERSSFSRQGPLPSAAGLFMPTEPTAAPPLPTRLGVVEVEGASSFLHPKRVFRIVARSPRSAAPARMQFPRRLELPVGAEVALSTFWLPVSLRVPQPRPAERPGRVLIPRALVEEAVDLAGPVATREPRLRQQQAERGKCSRRPRPIRLPYSFQRVNRQPACISEPNSIRRRKDE